MNNQPVYNWEIDLGDPNDLNSKIVISVKPHTGLLSKWRFILPANYQGLTEWGVIEDGKNTIREPRGIFETGNIQLQDGQVVVVIGGLEAISKIKAARLVLSVPPPNFLGFGFSEDDAAAPINIEGISFEALPHEKKP